VSIRDVAQKAGVALSSVSRVLNGSGYASKELRDRVHKAVTQLKFQPNAYARGLRAAQSKTLGLVLRDVANTTFATLWKAAVDAASDHGYSVLVTSSENSRTKEEECLQLMLQQQVDGVVGFVADETQHAYRRVADRIPLVLVESDVLRLPSDKVFCGNFDGAYSAARHLLEHNHRRVVLLSGAQTRFPGRERRRGFETAFKEADVTLDPQMVYLGSHLSAEDRARLARQLAPGVRPTAIFAASAHLTLEALGITRQIGLRVPEDISFIGFDNRDLASLSSPSITTVERDIYKLGATAVELLIRRIQNPASPFSAITIPTELVVRSSVYRAAEALA
jgi:LacI family transcriptional regulator